MCTGRWALSYNLDVYVKLDRELLPFLNEKVINHVGGGSNGDIFYKERKCEKNKSECAF